MTRTLRIAIYALAINFFAIQVASAIPVRIDYTGTVNTVIGNEFGYSVNDSISGWFTFDTDSITTCNGFGCSANRPTPFASNINADDYAVNNDQINLRDNATTGFSDSLSIYKRTSQSYDSADFETRYFDEIEHSIFLTDYDEWLDVENFLLTGSLVVDPSDFLDHYGLLKHRKDEQSVFSSQLTKNEFVRFSIDTITFTAQKTSNVSEPSTIALLGLGIAALGISRKKRS